MCIRDRFNTPNLTISLSAHHTAMRRYPQPFHLLLPSLGCAAGARVRLQAPRCLCDPGCLHKRHPHACHGCTPMMSKDEKSFNQNRLSGSSSATARPPEDFLGRTAKSLVAFDLAVLPSLSWVPSCALRIHDVGYASVSE